MSGNSVLLSIGLLLLSSQAASAQGLTPERERELIQANIERVEKEIGNDLLSNADEIVARHVAAIGGERALKSIRTMALKGRNIILAGEQRPLERFYMSPDYFRQQAPGGEGWIFSDGAKVYGVSPAGRSEMTQPWAAELAHERIDDNFLDYSERGITYEYVGLESFATEPTVFYRLRRTFPDGYSEDLYFDVATGLFRIKRVESIDAFRVYYEYRNVGGVLFPHLWMRLFGENTPPHVFIVDEIRVNEEYEDSFFTGE